MSEREREGERERDETKLEERKCTRKVFLAIFNLDKNSKKIGAKLNRSNFFQLIKKGPGTERTLR